MSFELFILALVERVCFAFFPFSVIFAGKLEI